MARYIIYRVAWGFVVLLVLNIVTYIMITIAPGSPFSSEKTPPPHIIALLEAKYGLDQPIHIQIWRYMVGIFTRFDFGPSIMRKGLDVSGIIATTFPISFTYAIISFIIAVTFGTALGICAAVWQNSWIDYGAIILGAAGKVLPNFILAPVLVLVFTLWLKWLPGGGWNGGDWRNLVMPVIALSTALMASIVRLCRGAMLEALHMPHIAAAKSRGIPFYLIIWRHAFKPVMLTLLTHLASMFAGVITGSMVIDVYFSTGGMGQFFVAAAGARDYYLVMGLTLFSAMILIVVNILIDIAYMWLDPKIKFY
ncbi:oligopeptide transport system permease protein [Maritalea mobilis]|uniref:Oligopeptide transport system permease protein n=1 Tax=Maritalea mobilis TaxID=483324 RepID=A0A4R6W340_9HYPH|nr:ABC transporter permease subunit [Maritalea mobilis]TDQ67425.1 oligopeptide transport system permease protein [Maritalea mobilis]